MSQFSSCLLSWISSLKRSEKFVGRSLILLKVDHENKDVFLSVVICFFVFVVSTISSTIWFAMTTAAALMRYLGCSFSSFVSSV